MKKQFRIKHRPASTGGLVDPTYARRPPKPKKDDPKKKYHADQAWAKFWKGHQS